MLVPFERDSDPFYDFILDVVCCIEESGSVVPSGDVT